MKINSPSLNESTLTKKTDFPSILENEALENSFYNQVTCHTSEPIDGLIMIKITG